MKTTTTKTLLLLTIIALGLISQTGSFAQINPNKPSPKTIVFQRNNYRVELLPPEISPKNKDAIDYDDLVSQLAASGQINTIKTNQKSLPKLSIYYKNKHIKTLYDGSLDLQTPSIIYDEDAGVLLVKTISSKTHAAKNGQGFHHTTTHHVTRFSKNTAKEVFTKSNDLLQEKDGKTSMRTYRLDIAPANNHIHIYPVDYIIKDSSSVKYQSIQASTLYYWDGQKDKFIKIKN